jgi:hypothetical protein
VHKQVAADMKKIKAKMADLTKLHGRSLLVTFDDCDDDETSIEVNNNNNKHAYAGQLNRLTHLKALLVLHDRCVLAHATSVADGWNGNANGCTSRQEHICYCSKIGSLLLMREQLGLYFVWR